LHQTTATLLGRGVYFMRLGQPGASARLFGGVAAALRLDCSRDALGGAQGLL